jgi:uncharacterized protein YwgA
MIRRGPHLTAALIIQDAGGELVGRTRLQKIAYLMQLAGFGEEFAFEYRHFGPYSEGLAQAVDIAAALGPLIEEERLADWGGRYSIYRMRESLPASDADRMHFVQRAKIIDSVELELAATAAYLFVAEGFEGAGGRDPWAETRRRKPNKAAEGRLERAALAYEELRNTKTRQALPKLPLLATA